MYNYGTEDERNQKVPERVVANPKELLRSIKSRRCIHYSRADNYLKFKFPPFIFVLSYFGPPTFRKRPKLISSQF